MAPTQNRIADLTSKKQLPQHNFTSKHQLPQNKMLSKKQLPQNKMLSKKQLPQNMMTSKKQLPSQFLNSSRSINLKQFKRQDKQQDANLQQIAQQQQNSQQQLNQQQQQHQYQQQQQQQYQQQQQQQQPQPITQQSQQQPQMQLQTPTKPQLCHTSSQQSHQPSKNSLASTSLSTTISNNIIDNILTSTYRITNSIQKYSLNHQIQIKYTQQLAKQLNFVKQMEIKSINQHENNKKQQKQCVSLQIINDNINNKTQIIFIQQKQPKLSIIQRCYVKIQQPIKTPTKQPQKSTKNTKKPRTQYKNKTVNGALVLHNNLNQKNNHIKNNHSNNHMNIINIVSNTNHSIDKHVKFNQNKNLDTINNQNSKKNLTTLNRILEENNKEEINNINKINSDIWSSKTCKISFKDEFDQQQNNTNCNNNDNNNNNNNENDHKIINEQLKNNIKIHNKNKSKSKIINYKTAAKIHPRFIQLQLQTQQQSHQQDPLTPQQYQAFKNCLDQFQYQTITPLPYRDPQTFSINPKKNIKSLTDYYRNTKLLIQSTPKFNPNQHLNIFYEVFFKIMRQHHEVNWVEGMPIKDKISPIQSIVDENYSVKAQKDVGKVVDIKCRRNYSIIQERGVNIEELLALREGQDCQNNHNNQNDNIHSHNSQNNDLFKNFFNHLNNALNSQTNNQQVILFKQQQSGRGYLQQQIQLLQAAGCKIRKQNRTTEQQLTYSNHKNISNANVIINKNINNPSNINQNSKQQQTRKSVMSLLGSQTNQLLLDILTTNINNNNTSRKVSILSQFEKQNLKKSYSQSKINKNNKELKKNINFNKEKQLINKNKQLARRKSLTILGGRQKRSSVMGSLSKDKENNRYYLSGEKDYHVNRNINMNKSKSKSRDRSKLLINSNVSKNINENNNNKSGYFSNIKLPNLLNSKLKLVSGNLNKNSPQLLSNSPKNNSLCQNISHLPRNKVTINNYKKLQYLLKDTNNNNDITQTINSSQQSKSKHKYYFQQKLKLQSEIKQHKKENQGKGKDEDKYKVLLSGQDRVEDGMRGRNKSQTVNVNLFQNHIQQNNQQIRQSINAHNEQHLLIQSNQRFYRKIPYTRENQDNSQEISNNNNIIQQNYHPNNTLPMLSNSTVINHHNRIQTIGCV